MEHSGSYQLPNTRVSRSIQAHSSQMRQRNDDNVYGMNTMSKERRKESSQSDFEQDINTSIDKSGMSMIIRRSKPNDPKYFIQSTTQNMKNTENQFYKGMRFSQDKKG